MMVMIEGLDGDDSWCVCIERHIQISYHLEYQKSKSVYAQRHQQIPSTISTTLSSPPCIEHLI
jgi:hypothetical protein